MDSRHRGAVAGGVIALIIAGGSTTTHYVTTTVVQQTAANRPSRRRSHDQRLTINGSTRRTARGRRHHRDLADDDPERPLRRRRHPAEEGEGAGVVYNMKGDILTDEHVVASETSVKVNFQDGKSYPATLVGDDPSPTSRVIHVDAPASELHPIPLANSNTAQVGDSVVAIGSPFSLPETVTAGIVSQTGRSITAPNGYTIPGAIQTDAAINPGNSGGPLLNADGQVIGLNDQIETNNTTATGEGSSSGVGFAIPSNSVAQVANQLISGKKIQHAYVGVSLTGNTSGGAVIQPVQPGTPATTAGLKPGDLITAVDGKAITSTDDFIAAIDTYQPDQTVTLSVRRGSQTLSVKVKLGVRPATEPTTATRPSPSWDARSGPPPQVQAVGRLGSVGAGRSRPRPARCARPRPSPMALALVTTPARADHHEDQHRPERAGAEHRRTP